MSNNNDHVRRNDLDHGSSERDHHQREPDPVHNHIRQSSQASSSSSASPRESLRRKKTRTHVQNSNTSQNGLPTGAVSANSPNCAIDRTGSSPFQHNAAGLTTGFIKESVHSAFSKYSDPYSSRDPTKPKLSLPLQNDSFIADSHSHSGKRKSFYLVPNFRQVESVNELSGVELCEKLFGIILCQYKHRPPRPSGAQTEQMLRERKVIVQGVTIGSQAEICGKIFRGDMLVGMNDADVKWVNIDDIFRLVPKQKVKLTFQVPLVIGPKPTPPVTPTTPPVPRLLPVSGTPPIPPHHSISKASTPSRPPIPPRRPTDQNLLMLTTGESAAGIATALRRHLLTVMYLSVTGQSDNDKDDVLYQYPREDNKLTDIRGLYQTLSSLLVNVTGSSAKLTCVHYRGNALHAAYWQDGADILMVCLPDSRVPPKYLQHILSDLLHVIKVLFGSIADVFRNQDFHFRLDQLIMLTLHRVLLRGVDTQSIPSCSPLEPVLLDTVTGIRSIRSSQDNRILCDEILSEFEAQDFTEFDEEIPADTRRNYGILGSCLYFKNYLLCSHLNPSDLRDVHLFLQYHSILGLVNRQSVNELVIWREFYPTRFCHIETQNVPGYLEPRASWFLLIVVMGHFSLCTVLEVGSYAGPVMGHPGPDRFLAEHAKATLAQLQADEANIEHCCNQSLLSDMSGPTLANAEADRHAAGRSEDFHASPGKLHPSPLQKQTSSPAKLEASPRFRDEADNISLHSLQSPDYQNLRRQDSHVSYGSNDSNSSGNSTGAKTRSVGRMGSLPEMNRSFSEWDIRHKCNMKLPRGVGNILYHYVSLDHGEGIYVSPTPADIASVDGALHQHILYNFHACCLKIRDKFDRYTQSQARSPASDLWYGVKEEGVMFTCEIKGSPDPKKPMPVLMYWVIGRLLPGEREMYVCLQDGASQAMLELAFRHGFGLR